MGDAVVVEIDGGVATVTIDNPPVNAFSHHVRVALKDAFETLNENPEVKAIVIACAGASFSAGADIRELGAPPIPPAMKEITPLIEAVRPLTIAAIHGQALGGGFEVTLLCDYRVATSNARVGLPEIKLGLMPGAGGTQRLPRLIGAEPALDIILKGDPISAKKAFELGIVDELTDGDVKAAGVALARKLLAEGAGHRRLRNLKVPPTDLDFVLRRGEALKVSGGLPAAGAAVDAVEAAVKLDFDAGLAREGELFQQCRVSVESQALRHLFAAERVVGTIPGIGKETPVRAVKRAAVIGAGTMGAGVAMALLNAGLPVVLVETAEAGLERGMKTIGKTYDSLVERGRLTPAARDEVLGRLTPTLALEQAGTADLVIECVFEDMGVKQGLFAKLATIMGPEAVLATNTSALDVNAIAEASGRPGDVVGMHFFSPANIMKLVEVVRADRTAPDVLATAMAVTKRMGKIGVVSGVCDGFIGNRMVAGYLREAGLLLLEGAAPEQVDGALRAFGMAMGPHAMGDMAGLDIQAVARKRRKAEGRIPDDPRFGAIGDALVEEGRFGLKTGKGMYRYEEGQRTPLPDPEVAALIEAEAKRLGVERRTFTDAEIIDRCLLPLVNEGARIIEEGIALGAADIDVVYCNGYGFPRLRGGPMFWADTQGLDTILRKIETFRDTLPNGQTYWQPAQLLAKLAKEGKKFSELERGKKF